MFLSVSSIPDTSHITAQTLILPAAAAALNTNTSRVSADAAPVLTTKVADTIDALMAGAASSAGKIRVFAILCDVSGINETDNNTDTQHDTAV